MLFIIHLNFVNSRKLLFSDGLKLLRLVKSFLDSVLLQNYLISYRSGVVKKQIYCLAVTS